MKLSARQIQLLLHALDGNVVGPSDYSYSLSTLRSLEEKGLLTKTKGGWCITDQGETIAGRITDKPYVVKLNGNGYDEIVDISTETPSDSMHEDGLTALESLLEDHSPREAARRYVRELGQASSFEETAGDLATIIGKLLSGDLPIPTEALESQLADRLDEISGSHLETLLDQKMRPDLEEGDYIVNVREVHEQMYLVRSDRADSLEGGLSVKLGREESAIIYGLPSYEREIQNQEVVVEKVGGGSDTFDYSHSFSD